MPPESAASQIPPLRGGSIPCPLGCPLLQGGTCFSLSLNRIETYKPTTGERAQRYSPTTLVPFLRKEKIIPNTIQQPKGCRNGFPFLQPLILYNIYIRTVHQSLTYLLPPVPLSAGRRDSGDTTFRKSSAAYHPWRASPGLLRFHRPASAHFCLQ